MQGVGRPALSHTGSSFDSDGKSCSVLMQHALEREGEGEKLRDRETVC